MKLLLENWRKYLNETEVGNVHRIPVFASCFEGKDEPFRSLLNKTLEIIEMVINRNVDNWPQTVECMSDEEIKEGENAGGGHGLYISGEQRLKINPNMDSFNIYLNFIHENIHHAKPELEGPKYSTQHRHIEINESLMKQVVDYVVIYLNKEEEIKEQIPEDFIKTLENYK